jgi:hypothetical protein
MGLDVSVCRQYKYQERIVRKMKAAGAEVALLASSRIAGEFSLIQAEFLSNQTEPALCSR